ncbi:MAG: uroporphyrinogen-III synthase [Rhodospirillaceae bacterium]|nr:uroporphyrinogen-III synthase [Rhodospirillaceae bacterium]
MIILNTRPSHYRESFASDFGGFSLPIIESALLKAQAIDAWLAQANDFDSLIFTSPFAPTLCPGGSDWRNKPVFAVGPATAAAARRAGFAKVLITGHTAEELVAVLEGQSFRRALYPSGVDITEDLSQQFGGRIVRSIVYRMTPVEEFSPHLLGELQAARHVFVPLFSRRSAETFVAVVRHCAVLHPQKFTAIGISKKALAVSQPAWGAAIIARVPTSASMAAALAEHQTTTQLAA